MISMNNVFDLQSFLPSISVTPTALVNSKVTVTHSLLQNKMGVVKSNHNNNSCSRGFCRPQCKAVVHPNCDFSISSKFEMGSLNLLGKNLPV